MTIAGIVEIFVNELIALIPLLILAIIPFTNNLRLSKQQSLILASLLYIFVSISRIHALRNTNIAILLTIIWILIYMGFYFLCFKTNFSKLLFVLFIILNYGSFDIIIVTYISTAIFNIAPDNAYSLHKVILRILILMLTYPVMYILMKKKIKPLVAFSMDNRVWNYLFMIPAIFCFIYYYNLYSKGGIAIFSSSLSNVIFASALNIGSLFVTYIVVELVNDSNYTTQLKEENHRLILLFVQHENMKTHIEEAGRARHDLRQSLILIQSYILYDDKEELNKYINQYLDTLPLDTPIVYTENYSLNIIIVYYADIAKKNNIRFNADIHYPKDTNLSDTDIVILFGNLLENALEASQKNTKDSFISLTIHTTTSSVIITLDNSCDGNIVQSNGQFHSTKPEHNGIGLSSIKNISKKYNGIAEFEYNHAVFHSSILLYI